jgi:hypothetical protein
VARDGSVRSLGCLMIKPSRIFLLKPPPLGVQPRVEGLPQEKP